MRDLGTPAYGKAWFHQILSNFPENSRIFCVRLGDQPVAASYVYLARRHDGGAIGVGAPEFNPMCPNTLLYWEMLQFAIGRGFRNFDFGRSTPGAGTSTSSANGERSRTS